MQQIYPTCPVLEHQKLNILEICIEKNCFTTPTVCCKCARERHYDHDNNLRSIDEIRGVLKKKQQRLNQIIEDYKNQIDQYKFQLEQIIKYEFEQIEQFISQPNYTMTILEKIAQFLKKDEYSEYYAAQQQLLTEFMTQQLNMLENITKNIEYKFRKESLSENNISTIQKYNNIKFASTKDNQGLFTIDPDLNHIQLKTIIINFKFQKVNWLYLGVTSDIQNYEKNVACITNHGTMYSTFNDQQQDTRQHDFQIRQDDVVQIAIIKAQKQLIICNQTKNCQATLTNINFQDMKFFLKLIDTELQVLD